jgi:hypothetical protein
VQLTAVKNAEITGADGTSAAVSSERQETEGLRGDIERLKNRVRIYGKDTTSFAVPPDSRTRLV